MIFVIIFYGQENVIQEGRQKAHKEGKDIKFPRNVFIVN
jgi:hypothetical protein